MTSSPLQELLDLGVRYPPETPEARPTVRSRGWCFTLNNYTDQEVLTLQDVRLVEVGMKYLCFGREVAPSTGTPHLQGYVYFTNAVRFTTVKSFLVRAKWIKAKGSPEQNKAYCSKDGNFVERGECPRAGKRKDLEEFVEAVDQGLPKRQLMREHPGVFARHNSYANQLVDQAACDRSVVRARDSFPSYPLRPWQGRIWEMLQETPDRSTIVWVYDSHGQSGKTWFAHYLFFHMTRVQIFNGGKYSDIANMVDVETRVFVFDVPRSVGDFLSYGVIECIKNGHVTSGKYQGMNKWFPPPHVLVFSNKMPPQTTDDSGFSSDRLHLIALSLSDSQDE